jgi:CheY-like chemotaxis protein
MNSNAQHTGVRANGRILVVDDEPYVLAVAKGMLESQNFDVTTCDSGDDAVEKVRQALYEGQRYSVILLDLTMPGGLSGFDVMDAITTTDPDAAVIACSGYFQEDARSLCQGIGFADIIQKPFVFEHVCATVRRFLSRDHSPQSIEK